MRKAKRPEPGQNGRSLTGVRVIELPHVLSTPARGLMHADLGADGVLGARLLAEGPRGTPRFGADTAEILAESGYDAAEIDALFAAGEVAADSP